MPILLYMDHNVPRAITAGLRLRGVDVIAAIEDGATELADPVLLDRAAALGRLLFSQDQDLLVEAQRRQRTGLPFMGVVFARQRRVSIGVCTDHLALIALAAEPSEVRDRVTYLPL